MGSRSSIIAATVGLLQASYGPKTGQWFRAVQRGPWQPGNGLRPACIVEDQGLRAVELFDGGGKLALKMQLVLDLAEHWGGAGEFEKWQDRIEQLNDRLNDWHPAAMLGVETINFLEDQPAEIILGDAASQFLWFVNYEVLFNRFR
jgi:hypothetical protein